MTQNLEHLLPRNATELEIAFSLATNLQPRFEDPIDIMRGIKYIATPPDWLPFLVYEYGLGELTPYVPNLFDLIREGIQWQRVRGTPAAVAMALDWVGYTAIIEEPPVRRARWHLFQLELDRVRDNEEPDLERIEGVTQLSVAVRSHFWRGFNTYDVRNLEYGWKKWSGALWGTYSGARLLPDHAKWSFGRLYELDHIMTEAELTALGVWIEPGAPSTVDGWEHVVWPHEQWSAPNAGERVDTIVGDLAAMTAWVTFLNADDEIIGHRKARAWHSVRFATTNPPYFVGVQGLRPVTVATKGLYIEAMTDFSDGFPVTAAKWQVRLGATLVDADRPGLLWAEPDELTGGIVACEKIDTIEFGRTVRERCRALLRVV